MLDAISASACIARVQTGDPLLIGQIIDNWLSLR
ncbi:hypothetical protein VS_II1270 [Vibrio atlanticus]|uniref:Uncharacterized protein n=1 Tax=Vibrio atlanticus (strain LGP32) TaxID=575788 RepID=B7VT17_VIBA3|nr:hypothetical protein VS_II1270 [Vibrio atlanticus]